MNHMHSRRKRGVALIEALVALAVMAFGMLGVAAMQATLRQNADLARQRAEAVRLAQESIESMRAYSVVNTVVGRVAYADTLVPVAPETLVRANATYTRTVFIAPNNNQNRKTVDVTVNWIDRAGAGNQVRLSSIIHQVPPELPAALAVPGFGTAAQLARGLNPTIPPGATPNPDGVTSTFTPPQTSSPNPITWIFNNASGLIVQRCVGLTCSNVGTNQECTSANTTNLFCGRLLSGYVAFSLGTVRPTPENAESPASNALSADVGIVQQLVPDPLAGTTTECFTETLPASSPTPEVRAYYCVIQVLSTDSKMWSGRSGLTGTLTASLAASVADTDSTKFRVCRYTPFRNNNAVGTGTPPIANVDHPYNYLDVDRNLVNQNFLLIRAGGIEINPMTGLPGPVAFDCPADVVPSLPALNLINSNTWHHQPAS